MKKNINILTKVPLFSEVAESDIFPMLGCLCANEKTFNKDEYILTEDSVPTEVGIILSGSVMIVKEDYWGNRDIISKLDVGDIFGESFLCAQESRIFVSVVAAEKTEVLFINYNKIVNTCSNACIFHAKLIQNMMKILASKNIMMNKKMQHVIQRTTKEKLLSYLSFEAKKAKSSTFTIPFNRQELADYLSVDRSAMSNELCKLRDEGILEFNKNNFRLL